MSENRGVPAERLIDLRLTRGIGQVIVAADDIGNRHLVVVDNDRGIVGGGAIAPQDNEIVQVLVGQYYAALHAIFDHCLAFARRRKANGWVEPWRRLWRIAMPPGAIVDPSAAVVARHLAHRLKFGGGREAAIGLALCEQQLGDCAVTLGARKLVNSLAIPDELEPAQ